MPRARPFIWALLPATARPRVKAASRLKPNRSATTVAQRVRTGARFTRIVRLCSEVFMLIQPRAPQEVAGIQLWPLDYRGNAGEKQKLSVKGLAATSPHRC